jgi:WD40 repeat protein
MHDALSKSTYGSFTLTVTGMVMAVKLVSQPVPDAVLVLSGYEGGLTAIHRLPRGSSSSVTPAQLIYLSQPHTQPILSLDVSSDFKTYYTSAADAVIAAHCIPDPFSAADLVDSASTQTNGSTAATSALDAASEVAIQPRGATAIGDLPSQDSVVSPEQDPAPLLFTKQRIPAKEPTTSRPAGLSSLLSSAPPQSKTNNNLSPPSMVTAQPPHISQNTKHAGQQSLRVRSDGRLFATGGWDSRIRIYSTKTMKEVAVLKWHKEGVYAVDFAQVLNAADLWQEEDSTGGEVVRKETGLGKLQKQREKLMQCKHWVVAGAKDGKVSLWEVF